MFGTRLIAFIIAVLLATHVIQPTDGWLIAMAVLIGLSLLRSMLTAPLWLASWGWRQGGWARNRRRWRWADEWEA